MSEEDRIAYLDELENMSMPDLVGEGLVQCAKAQDGRLSHEHAVTLVQEVFMELNKRTG